MKVGPIVARHYLQAVAQLWNLVAQVNGHFDRMLYVRLICLLLLTLSNLQLNEKKK